MRSSVQIAPLLRAGATMLMLSLALAGCKPRGGDPPKPDPNAGTPKPAPVQPAPEKPSEFAVRPPEVVDIQVTPLSDGEKDNARLDVRFAPDKRLKDAVTINVADAPVEFRRSGEQPDVFSAVVSMDLKALREELSEAGALAEKQGTVLRFRNRQLEQRVDVRRVATQFRGTDILVRERPIRIGIDISRLGAFLVDPERELLVTATSVVEDPARTFDPCTGAGTPGGAWTFAKLMRDMANHPSSGVKVEEFVMNWLQTWNAPQSTLSFPVPARTAMQSVIANWPKLPNGKLDVEKAPFRLLAIVNRLDLRTGSAYAAGDAGEGRFVFGLVNQAANGTCAASSTRPFTVILEYKVPKSGCTAVHDYAAQWRALGDIALGDPAYNAALQAITDQFTAAGAAPSSINGSAIGQIRTNENALAPEWELREFELAADHHLHLVNPDLAPQTSLNNTAVIDQFINANLVALAKGGVATPPQFGSPASNFQAGSSMNGPPVIAWKGPATPAAHAEQRFQFSLATCNSCHGREVQHPLSLSPDTFLHIRPRPAGGVSTLSAFLVGDGTLAAPTTHAFVDPVFPSITRDIGDLADRRGKLAGAAGRCRSLGLIEELRFQPLRMPH